MAPVTAARHLARIILGRHSREKRTSSVALFSRTSAREAIPKSSVGPGGGVMNNPG